VKKSFFLGIRVDNIQFHRFTGKLRVSGTIEKGPEDLVPLGSHHTIDLKLNSSVRIIKEKWSRWHRKRIKEAIKASMTPKALVVVIEDDIADLGILRQYGIEYYGPIIGGISGKRVIMKNRQKLQRDFFENVASTINSLEGVEGIIIAGPGFSKNDLHKYLTEKYPEKAAISRLESTGSGGRVGIGEVVKKGILEEMAIEGRIAHEMSMVNKILEEIGQTSSLVTYGKNEVKNAVDAGAVEHLLVIDELVRVESIEKLMDQVENLGGKVMVVSSEHDGGKQLKALGGMAALLRYSIG
jgi:protein pelota